MGRDFYNQLQVLENTKAEDSGGIHFPDNTHVGVEVDYGYDSAHARESCGNQSACGTYFCLYCFMKSLNLGVIYLPEAM